MHYKFFESALIAERKLMPKSESWWEKELAEKRIILKAFWNERIIKLHQKSVDEFKEYLIQCHFPRSAEWQQKIEHLFTDALSGEIDFEDFFNTLKYWPLVSIRSLANFEQLNQNLAGNVSEIKTELGANDFLNIKRYMVEKRVSASVALGNAEGKIAAPDFTGNSASSYAMHSVGKVFTGMLALIMARKGVLSEEDFNQPPVKLDEAVKKALPPAVAARLEKVSLHQLMTHRAGLGDYLGNY